MRWKDIISRLNGVSTPLGGLSWNPTATEKDIAREIIIYMEDRRVLYVPSEIENPEHCIRSIIEIRKFITEKLQLANEQSKLVNPLRNMRASCRKFLNKYETSNQDIRLYGAHTHHYLGWQFISALGELRGIFGQNLALIAALYKLDIEDDLAAILPEGDDPV